MKSRYFTSRTAVFAAALYTLPLGCDTPTEETPTETPPVEVEENRVSEPPATVTTLDTQASVDPSEVFIQEIKTNGKGCPKEDPNTVEVVISDDRKSFAILYQDMELKNPPGPTVKNLSCQAAVKLHIPNGYQIALATVNTRGYLYLDKKIRARETSGYSFAGVPVGSYPHTTIKGPFDDFYEFSDQIPFESLVWSECNASAIFLINTTLNLNSTENPNGQAIFSTNDTDGMFRTVLHWQFREC